MFANRFAIASPAALRREIDDFFGSVFGDGGARFSFRRTFPALNMWEDAERVFVEAELPGLTMNEVEVLVVGNELTVKGSRKAAEEAGVTMYRQERGTGDFSRTITLPYEVDTSRVDATLKDGVLTIVLPKSDKAKPRKIEVRPQ